MSFWKRAKLATSSHQRLSSSGCGRSLLATLNARSLGEGLEEEIHKRKAAEVNCPCSRNGERIP